ncbi:MAG: carbonic anhydrase [Candidatus Eisenbacteria bacterium]
MNKFLSLTVAGLALSAIAASSFASGGGPGVTADEAYDKLKEGNERFVTGKMLHPNYDRHHRFETAKGQHPFVTVIGCSDSRVPIEVVFDQGIGDTFIIRVAGNVCDTDEVGSIEYGVDHLETPLLVVLGHESCGAVTAVVKKAELHGSIPALVDNIEPAVEHARKLHPRLSPDDLVPFAVRANVMQSIEDLLTRSDSVRERAKNHQVRIVGAVYDLETGKVSWLGEHPRMGSLLKSPTVDAHGDSHDDDHAGGQHH